MKFPVLFVATWIALAFSRVDGATAQFVVRNTNDDGAGSLRQAIVDANSHPNDQGPDFISFAIPGSGVHTILLESALPEITEPVIIDGWTQPGWNGAPLIELTADAGVTVDGLAITGGTTTIRGLVMNGFQNAIKISQNGNNTVVGCYLGTDKTGHQTVPNDRGIFSNATSNNVIGGTTAAERNIISGSRFSGIYLLEADARFIKTTGNTIQGNYVGTDITGTVALPNCTGSAAGQTGISVISNNAKIGGPDPGAGNLVSGNAAGGIFVEGQNAVIAGNIVGTDITGSVALPNNGIGIFMASLGGIMGGTAPGDRNLVSGNISSGVRVDSSNGLIRGNFIGTDVNGKIGIQNGGGGMTVGGTGNVVGGDAAGAGNLISGNTGTGLSFYVAFSPFTFTNIPPLDNVVQGNFIGTDVTGTAALSNGRDGIFIPAYRNQIGGSTPGAGNLISGNLGDGISVGPGSSGSDFTPLKVRGNLIGTKTDGATPLGNGGNGIGMVDATNTIIGSPSGADADLGNVIAFNLRNGIDIKVSKTPVSPHKISANSIHDNGLLGIDLGDDGVSLNDAGDADSGANGLQNYPVITDAFGFNGNLTIYGRLSSTASQDFTLEFFANQTADSSGFGEGKIFLGQAKVTTSASGDVNFNVTFALPSNVTAVSATAIDSNGNTSEFAADANISPTAPSPPPTGPTKVLPAVHSVHLLNISTRVRVEIGDHAPIAGFIVGGTEPKKVIVRGIGPSLTNFGVPGALGDPVLELHDASGKVIASNDNWRSDQQSEIQMSGLAPTNDLESAIVANLSPGNYTAILRGKGDTTGIGVVEAYDLGQGAVSHLGNVSTRGFVGTGDNIMIGGVVVGESGGTTAVVLRALGPSLANAGIADALPDPTLEVHTANGSTLATNDDWRNDFRAKNVDAAHLGPSDDRESALYETLAPGNYTAIVRGKNNSTGVALVEVYDLGVP